MKQSVEKERAIILRPVSWIRGVVLPLLILLMIPSCMDDTPGADSSSKKGNRKLSFALKDNSYSGNQTLLRGWGGEESETVTIPLPGGFFATATLQASPVDITRAADDTTNILIDTKVRLLAYEMDASKNILGCKLNKIYTVTADKKLDAGNDSVVLTDGLYAFVAYYYREGALRTVDPRYHENDTVRNINPSDDLMWGRSGNSTDPTYEVSEQNHEITLAADHKFSRITVVTSTKGVLEHRPTIGIGNEAAVINSNKATLTVKTGDVVSEAIDTAPLTWNGNNTDSVTSNPVIVFCTDNPVVRLQGLTLTTGTSSVNLPVTNVSFRTLKPGMNYTLRINFQRTPTFANSNIYWDGSKLTFLSADNPVTAQQEDLYHGVQFSSGSLVGISPKGDISGATFIYGWKTNSSPAGWIKTTIAGAEADSVYGVKEANKEGNATGAESHQAWIQTGWHWMQGKVGDAFLRNHGRDINYVYALGDSVYDGIGDICRFIGRHGGPSGYRMPTSSEFGGVGDSTYQRGTQSVVANLWDFTSSQMINPVSPISGLNDEGTSLVTNYVSFRRTDASSNIVLTKFPAVSPRLVRSDPGGSGPHSVTTYGGFGFYMSGSLPDDGTISAWTHGPYLLEFSNSMVAPASYSGDEVYGVSTPVRCVKIYVPTPTP